MLKAENIDDKRWTAARARLSDRQLEEPRPRRPASPGGRGAGLRQWQGRGALRALPGAAEDPQRRRFRRSPARIPAPVARKSGRAARVSAALQIYSGGRISGHQRRAISLAAAAGPAQGSVAAAEPVLRRRRRPVDLWLARRRGRQYPALREGFSRRQGRSGWSAITARPAIFSPPPRISSPTTATVSARPCSPTANEGEKPTVAGVWDSEEEARVVGEEIEQLQRQGAFARRDGHSRARLVPDARIRGALHHARPALQGDRRPALLRARSKSATRSPICAASPSRPTISPSSASSTRPSAGLGEGTLQIVHEFARLRQIPLMQAARALVETEELRPKPRGTLRALLGDFARWSALIEHEAASRTGRADAGGIRLYRFLEAGAARRRPRGGWKTSRN